MTVAVFDPTQRRKISWDVGVSFAVVLAVVLAPLEIALRLPPGGVLRWIDLLLSIVFVLDIAVQFNTGFVERRRLVTDRAAITRRYLRGRFWADAIAIAPLFVPGSSPLVSLTRIARFLRLTRVFKIFVVFRSLNRLSHTNISSNAIRLLIMVFWLLVTAHLVACGLILVGGVSADGSPGMRYLQSYYWTITTLATVGYGDIIPDRNNPLQLIFTILAQMIGVGMYGYVIGNIASVISNLDVSKTAFMEKLEKVNTFMKYRDVPDSVVRRVNDYYYYLWDTRHGYNEATTVAELPRSIRLELAQEIHREVIRTVPFFRDASPSFIRDIVLHLEPLTFTPGDTVIHRGDAGSEMYFISRGTVDVLGDDEGTTVATLREGEFFGEIALLNNLERTATIRAREYCDLYALDRGTFDRVLARHPEFAETVRNYADARGGTLGGGKA